MSIATRGTMGVDWEARVDFDRLRDERLARLRAELERSRWARCSRSTSRTSGTSATHIGTWAMDKLIRFSLLTRNTDPISWDFGSAAKHHRCYNPWLRRHALRDGRRPERAARGRRRARGWSRAPGPASRRCAARSRPTREIAEEVARKIKRELEKFGLLDEPLGVDVIELPDPVRAAAARASRSSTASRCSWRPAGSRPTTRSRCSPRRRRWWMPRTRSSTEFLRPGVRENECVGLVAKTLYDLGSEYVEGVNAISGERCSPHPHVFSDRLIRPGDPAFFDILHSFNGYRTCYYRTFAVGSASSGAARTRTRGPASTWTARSPWCGRARRPPTSSRCGRRREEFGFPDEEAAFALQYGHGVGLSIWEKPIFSRLVSLDHPEELAGGHGLRPRDLLAVGRRMGRRPHRGGARRHRRRLRGHHQVPRRGAARRGRPAVLRRRRPAATVRDSQSHLNTPEGRGEKNG